MSDEINRLPPSLREKQRYMKFSIHAEENIELGEAVSAIWGSALNYLGEKGCSESNFWVIGNRFNREKQEGILRVRRERESDLRAALSLVEEFGSKKGFLKIEKTSGSIKKLRND